jgi:hypothetical protein
MNLRIIGAPDLVRAWAAKLEALFGIVGKEYPSHRGPDLRWYATVDDRVAEAAGMVAPPAATAQAPVAAATRRRSGATVHVSDAATAQAPVAVKKLPRKKRTK